MTEDRDVIAEARKHLSENPTADFLDKVAGRVMDAADEVERRMGPLSEKESAAVVAILADRAVMQIAVSLAARKPVAEESTECEIGCTCIYCIPGA